MKLTRRDFHRFLLVGLAGVALPVSATPPSWVEGRDYEPILPPQLGESPGKIEVLEFFSYGCPHCKDFHPLVMAWAARLPKDVGFRRVPVSFGRAAWADLARLYHSLEATGDLVRLDLAAFRAIHEERTNLYTPDAILAWAKRQGVDQKRFADAFESFGINTRLSRDEQLVKNYKVQGVPLLTVGGRYAVTGKATKGLADLLPIADGLIARVREAGGTKR
jgi:thiol:disulfide interchange protein DsbA